MTLKPPFPSIEPGLQQPLSPNELRALFAGIQENFDFIFGKFPIQGADLMVGTGWEKPTLLSSWENYEAEAGTFSNAFYRKGVDGRVTVIGLVKHPAAGAPSTTIFTLPEGFRPAKQLIFKGEDTGGTSRIDVAANGAVAYGGGSATVGYLSLSGISFYPA